MNGEDFQPSRLREIGEVHNSVHMLIHCDPIHQAREKRLRSNKPDELYDLKKRTQKQLHELS